MRTVKFLLAGVIIFWGLLALLVRGATPFIADYRPSLEATIGAQLGTPVEIDALSARWSGLRPLVELRGIRIGRGDEQLTIDRAGIDIAPTGLLGLHGGSVRDRLIGAVRLTLDGLDLTVVREPGGRYHLEGLGPLDPAGESGAPTPLPSRLHLINTRVTWIDRKTGTPPLAIPDLAILIQRDGQRLDLRARLETEAGRAEASAQLEGFLVTTKWSGNSYLRVSNVDVARLLRPYLPSYYGLRSLKLNLETWMRWNDATPVHSAGEFSLRQLRLRPTAADAGELDLAAASADYSLRRDGDRLLLGLKGLRLAFPERVWPKGDIAVSIDRGGEGISLGLFADYLNLADVSRIARVRLPWPEVAVALDGLQPQGAVRDLRLQLRRLENVADWRGRAEVEGLSWLPWRGVPGLEGISGRVDGQTGLARLTLDSRDITLRFDSLFRNPLAFDRVDGALELTYDHAGWSAVSDRLIANSPHLETNTRFALQQRMGERPFLDLQTAFANGDAGAASLYYPAGVMGPRLVQWLDHAIRGGRIEGGRALFHGPIEDFAFEKTRSGSFQVIFDTADIDLHYRAGWPALERLAAQVRFRGNRLDIQGLAGAIYDSQVRRLDARMASLKPASPIEVRATLVGPLADTLRVLQEDALRDRFGDLGAALRGTGNARTDLDFAIPLREPDGGDYRLQGALNFLGAGLTLPDWALQLTELDGALDFTLDGISASDIQAKGLGSQVGIDVFALEDGGTRVRATARLNTEAIARQLPALPLSNVDGSSRFVIDVDIPSDRLASQRATWLGVVSDLSGMAIDLPAPIGKAATDRRSLTVRIPLGGREAFGTGRYGDALAARFSTDGRRIGIAVGGETARPPRQPGLRIDGRLETLDIAAWEAARSRLIQPGAGELPRIDVNLQLARALWAAHAFEDVMLSLQHDTGAWQGRVQAPTIAGRFTVPANLEEAPIEVDLERLDLAYAIGDDAGPAPEPDHTTATDPTGLAGLTLAVERLRVNEADLGTLTLVAKKHPEGLHITALKTDGESLGLDAEVRWTKGPDGIMTALNGTASTTGLGDLLVGLGYSRQLEEAPSRIELGLSWPGDPFQAQRATLEGRLTLDIGAGRLVELDPGVTRVVGLLNLNALTRRLRLDFSDFYKQGFSFDSIVGDFQFDDGAATTENLEVLGPTGRINVEGRTNLRAKTLDQRVRVTPNFSATLPIAGTIAGGPVAGVAILVAQEVFSDGVDEVNRFEYAVEGPWANPEIKQLDSGGTLSKLLRPLRGGTDSSDGPALVVPNETTSAHSPEPSPSGTAETVAPARTENSPLTRPLRSLLDVLKRGEIDTDNLAIDQD